MKELIVAYGANREIGQAGHMPWGVRDMRDDMARFRRLTVGTAVIMGRNTYESIGRPLPERHNIVVTRDNSLCGVTVVQSLEQAYEVSKGHERVMIIGGAMLYVAALEAGTIDVVHATEIHAEFPGADTFFPELPDGFVETIRESHAQDERNNFDYDFVTSVKRIPSIIKSTL